LPDDREERERERNRPVQIQQFFDIAVQYVINEIEMNILLQGKPKLDW
jgi:hypothetical protein